MVQSFFSRQGGKSRLRKRMVKKFPSDYTVYVEPFIGAGHIFLDLSKRENVKYVINDLDEDVYHIFTDVQKISQHDADSMDFTPSRNKWKALHNSNPSSPKARLYKNLYVNYHSYGGMNTHYSATQKKTGQRFKDNLDEVQQQLKGVTVLNQDYKSVIKKYDSPSTFFYLDPPYHETDLKGYKHKTIDIDDFANQLRNIKGKFLLSYNDHPYIRKAFQGFKIRTIATTYGMRGMDKPVHVRELMISNY